MKTIIFSAFQRKLFDGIISGKKFIAVGGRRSGHTFVYKSAAEHLFKCNDCKHPIGCLNAKICIINTQHEAVDFVLKKVKPKSGNLNSGIMNNSYAAELIAEFYINKQINGNS